MMSKGWTDTLMRAALLVVLLVSLILAVPTVAQTPGNDDQPGGAPPNFTIQSIQDQLSELPDPEAQDDVTASELTVTQIEQIRTSLQTARNRLEDAAEQVEAKARFAASVDSGRTTLSALRDELASLQSEMANREPLSSDEALIGAEAMFATEQELIAKESELRSLQAQLEGYRTRAQEITARLTAAPRELSEARSQLAEITAQLVELGTGELEPVGEARRKALRAQDYFRRQQADALEMEIDSLPLRQEIASARRNLAELRAEVLTEEILALQDLTGQRKVVEARQQVEQVRQLGESLVDAHPLVSILSADNLRLAEMIRDMAADEPITSRRLASVRGQTANVQNDLTAANELVTLGQLDREAGATLRRLANQLPATQSLRSDLREIRRDLAQLTRQRVVAQENLRDLPIGVIDPQAELEKARQEDPALPRLTEYDELIVSELSRQKRAMLREISATATSRINAVAELQSAQRQLVEETSSLRTLLDENLLWVRSVPAIDLNWPIKVIAGATELFSPEHLSEAWSVLSYEAVRLWPLTILFALAIALIVWVRPALWKDIEERASMVGRVQRDSLWHTPAVIGAGFIIALPWPLLFLYLAVLFGASNNPDLLVSGLADCFRYLGLLTLFLMSWQAWDRDGSLFGAHFKMGRPLREAIQTNFRWFIPLVGLSSFLLTLTIDQRGENIYEGFSLAAFLVTALALSVFFIRLLWQRKTLRTPTPDDGFLERHRVPVMLVTAGIPFFAAVMAGAGWFESADDILLRYFVSVYILLFGYVVFGTVRRAIVVAQRQIKYRQAVEKREALIKQRREAEEAEQRGEEPAPPPPVDTSAIDVTVISRQSLQLLRAMTAIGIAVMLYFNWSGLLPALTIFDGFVISEIDTGALDLDGQPVTRSITLWTVLQALAIGAIAIIAARNLPGFLEIFVLDRLGFDAGSRYAIVTIIGYIIIAIGVVIFFQRLGLQWDQLQWIVTGLSVGIGFGLQKIIANFVSGLILLFERPIRIGDFVTIGDKSGTVTRIKIRATTLGDLDNREILIPNENLISQEVTNWTLSNSVTRVIVNVGIAYGSDTEKAREIMLETLKETGKILETPPPQVFFLGFGDSSLDFELRFFLRKFEDRFPVSHQVHTDVNKALAKHGFEIPFPQRDLNWRGQSAPFDIKPTAPKRSSGTTKKAPAKKSPPKTPTN